MAVVAVGSRQPESKIDPMTTLALTTSWPTNSALRGRIWLGSTLSETPGRLLEGLLLSRGFDPILPCPHQRNGWRQRVRTAAVALRSAGNVDFSSFLTGGPRAYRLTQQAQ